MQTDCPPYIFWRMTMAKDFGYMTHKGVVLYDDPVGRMDYLAGKKDGFRGVERHTAPSQAKTDPQLGFYWGLLVPLITKAINGHGWTITIGKGKAQFERMYTDNDTHVWLKEFAAKIGEEGEYVTLSEQDKEMCRKYIDNVMWIMDHWFKMDIEAIKKKRPEREAEDA